MWYNFIGDYKWIINNKFIGKDVRQMEKQELTLEQARQELENYVDKLERWQEIPKEEQFISSYRVNLISHPFINKMNSLIVGPEMTPEEMKWQKVIYQFVRFRRAFEELWKAKEEYDIEFARKKTLREIQKLLKEYDNYVAGE